MCVFECEFVCCLYVCVCVCVLAYVQYSRAFRKCSPSSSSNPQYLCCDSQHAPATCRTNHPPDRRSNVGQRVVDWPHSLSLFLSSSITQRSAIHIIYECFVRLNCWMRLRAVSVAALFAFANRAFLCMGRVAESATANDGSNVVSDTFCHSPHTYIIYCIECYRVNVYAEKNAHIQQSR